MDKTTIAVMRYKRAQQEERRPAFKKWQDSEERLNCITNSIKNSSTFTRQTGA
jgi:hypothetical protein